MSLVSFIASLIKKYRNFILYCIIGVINTGVDFGVYTVLTLCGMYYIAAHVISYHCGIVCSFLLNRYYNFKVKDKPMQRFASFYGISLVALVASAGLLYLFVDICALDKILGKLIATAIIVVVQFLLVKTFTFKKSAE